MTIKHINRLLMLVLITVLIVYVLALNDTPIQVAFSDNLFFHLTSGQLLISAFVFGLLLSFLFALYLGVRHYLRERGFESRERQRLAFYDAISRARGLSAAGNFTKAAIEWEKQIKRDPTHSIARVELARCLDRQGETREALRVLDAARLAAPENIEVLMCAAELHRSLGNRTAAIDNLALVLLHQPSAMAALEASRLSEELGRFDDALEYLGRAEQMDADRTRVEGDRARITMLILEREKPSGSDELIDGLRALARRDPPFIPALIKLADCEAARGRIEEAVRCDLSVSRLTAQSDGWRRAIERWLMADKPERALGALRTAISEASGNTKMQAELDLIRLYIMLDMLDEAKRVLELHSKEIEQLAAISSDARDQLALLRMILAAQSDNQPQLRLEKRRLLSFGPVSQRELNKQSSLLPSESTAPSPSLSTP